MADGRPIASVSLDLDNLWSYLKTRGDERWQTRPSYLGLVVPLALQALDRLGMKITFFIVGADAAQPDHRAVLRSIPAAGHNVGNHSYEHEPWLHRYEPEQVAAELEKAEIAVTEATGQRPVGFRGPGYSWSATVLEVLVSRGYRYDASTLPTFVGPLARAYYFFRSPLDRKEREQRSALFGSLADGLRPLSPYRWKLPSGASLLEIPVSTMPVLRMPFHLSYLLFLARHSETLMAAYLATALTACRATGLEPSILLHPLDLVGGDEVSALEFFPGMDIPGERKRALFHRAMSRIAESFRVVTMEEHADALAGRRLREVAA